jgi:hypothetical protein
MRTSLFLIGFGFLELLAKHWNIDFKIGAFGMMGITVFFIYLCILDWIAVYWNSRLHNWKED